MIENLRDAIEQNMMIHISVYVREITEYLIQQKTEKSL